MRKLFERYYTVRFNEFLGSNCIPKTIDFPEEYDTEEEATASIPSHREKLSPYSWLSPEVVPHYKEINAS